MSPLDCIYFRKPQTHLHLYISYNNNRFLRLALEKGVEYPGRPSQHQCHPSRCPKIRLKKAGNWQLHCVDQTLIHRCYLSKENCKVKQQITSNLQKSKHYLTVKVNFSAGRSFDITLSACRCRPCIHHQLN